VKRTVFVIGQDGLVCPRWVNTSVKPMTEQALQVLVWLAQRKTATVPRVRDGLNIASDTAQGRLMQLDRRGYVRRCKMPRMHRAGNDVLWQVTEAGRKLVIARMER
jgi:DNA-binding MarR family transcriptional regulator